MKYCKLSDYWIISNNIEDGYLLEDNLIPDQSLRIRIDKTLIDKDNQCAFIENCQPYLEVKYYFIDLNSNQYAILKADTTLVINGKVYIPKELEYIETSAILDDCKSYGR